MSRNFEDFPVFPYIGQFFSMPVDWCGVKQNAMPINIDWLVYGASSSVPRLGVGFNFQLGINTPGVMMEKLAGVYIDNTNSPNPVYVRFQNNFVLTCQPFAVVFAPVLVSNSLQFAVYGDGFVTGQIPSTRIFLFEKSIVPFTLIERPTVIDYWIASPSIQRPSSQIFNLNFGPPALGDQSAARGISLPGAHGTTQTVFPIAATGYYYLTGISAAFVGYSRSAGGSSFIDITLRNATITTDTLMSFTTHVNGGDAAIGRTNVMDLVGMNLKLDATQGWELFGSNIPGSINNGQFVANFIYTFNPNM